MIPEGNPPCMPYMQDSRLSVDLSVWSASFVYEIRGDPAGSSDKFTGNVTSPRLLKSRSSDNPHGPRRTRTWLLQQGGHALEAAPHTQTLRAPILRSTRTDHGEHARGCCNKADTRSKQLRIRKRQARRLLHGNGPKQHFLHICFTHAVCLRHMLGAHLPALFQCQTISARPFCFSATCESGSAARGHRFTTNCARWVLANAAPKTLFLHQGLRLIFC